MKLSLQLKNIEIIFSVILKSPFIAVNQKLKWICSKPLFPFSFPKIIFTFNTFRSILQFKKKKSKMRRLSGNLQPLQGLTSASTSLGVK